MPLAHIKKLRKKNLDKNAVYPFITFTMYRHITQVYYTSSLKFGNGKCNGFFEIPDFLRISMFFETRKFPIFRKIDVFHDKNDDFFKKTLDVLV